MHEVEAVLPTRPLQPASLATLPSRQPDLPTLYAFMTEAELRFTSLRLRISDLRAGALGEETETTEVWLRHPGRAKVVQSRGSALERNFDIWLTDGESVQTYDARNDVVTRRRQPARPAGADSASLPAHARAYVPVTPLPAETLAETFVHPHGFCRNVLVTGHTAAIGTGVLIEREVLLLRCDHPRTSHVLTDRADHWLEVAVDYQTGLILLLAEHVGGHITRRGEVTSLGLDEPIGDDAFRLHVSADARRIY
jgi:hypothetical protein